MVLSEVKTHQFVRMDNLFMMKLPNGDFDCAMEGSKLKSGSFHIDITVKPATKEEFIQAVNNADHQDDWYSMLLKDLMLDRVSKL